MNASQEKSESKVFREEDLINSIENAYEETLVEHQGRKSRAFALAFFDSADEVVDEFCLKLRSYETNFSYITENNNRYQECFVILNNGDMSDDIKVQYRLAKCYKDGQGVSQNDAIYLSIFWAAAEALYNIVINAANVPQNEILDFKDIYQPTENNSGLWGLALHAFSHGINVHESLFDDLSYKYASHNKKKAAEIFFFKAGKTGKARKRRNTLHQDIFSIWKEREVNAQDFLWRERCNKIDFLPLEDLAPNKNEDGNWNGYVASAEVVAKAQAWCVDKYGIDGVLSDEKVVRMFEAGLRYFDLRQDNLSPENHDPYEVIKVAFLLQKASDAGHIEAPFFLGLLYEYGQPNGWFFPFVDQNKERSIQYYRLAASRGSLRAKFKVASFDLEAGATENSFITFSEIAKIGLTTYRKPGRRYEWEGCGRVAGDDAFVIAMAKLFCIRKSIEDFAFHDSANINYLTESEQLCNEVLQFSVEKMAPPNSLFIPQGDWFTWEDQWTIVAIFAKMFSEQIKHLEAIKQKDEEKKRAIEDLMAMVSHQFRGEIRTIVYNAENENDKKRYLHVARTMSGLIELTGILSTKPDHLLNSIANDNIGEGSPSALLLYSVKDLLIDLLDTRNREKMSPYYLAYSKRNGRVPESLGLADWSENPEWQELEEKLRVQWQSNCENLETSNFEALSDWFEKRILPVQVIGFSESRLRFNRYGIKASILRVIFTELVKNAIKHSYPEAGEPIILTWSEKDNDISLSCSNPSSFGSRMRNKGSGRGHSFLSLLANSLGGTFENHVFANPSWVCLHLPKLA